MIRLTGISLLLVLLHAGASSALGQSAPNWRVFRAVDGMPESACLSLSGSTSGRLIIRHLTSAVAEFDGYQFREVPTPENTLGRVYQSPSGQLWTTAPRGLAELRGTDWIIHPQPEIAEAFRTSATRVDPLPLLAVRHGLVLFLTRNGLYEFNLDDPRPGHTTLLVSAETNRIGPFVDFCAARNGGVMVAGKLGVLTTTTPLRSLTSKAVWQAVLVPQELEVGLLRPMHEDAARGITMVGENLKSSERVVVHLDGDQWRVRRVTGERIRAAWRGPEGTVWAFATDSLLQWPSGSDQVSAYEELGSRQYYDVATEPDGTFWLATSDGLYRFGNLPWRTSRIIAEPSSQVFLITQDLQNRLVVYAGNTLSLVQENQARSHTVPAGLRREMGMPLGLCALKTGQVLLGGRQGSVLFDPHEARFVSLTKEKGQQLRILGQEMDGTVLGQEVRNGGVLLVTYDGNEPDTNAFPQPPAEIGLDWTKAHFTRDATLWLASETGVAACAQGTWKSFLAKDGRGPGGGLSFVEHPDRRVWLATRNEIWEYNKGDWLVVRRSADQLNGMTLTDQGIVWVAASSGLQVFVENTWLDQGIEDGLPSVLVWTVFEDARRQLWAGTSRGLAYYQPEADVDPPRTTVQPLAEPKQWVEDQGTVTVDFRAVDRWKQTARARLLYSHRINEREWSPFKEQPSITISELTAGKQVFQVKAMDRSGNIEPNPAQLDFMVTLPWYREQRLIWISLFALAGVLFFAGLAINRHLRLLRSYAEVERKVQERTRELDLANQELLQSQKMKALGTLAAGIAHDFNNILSIVKGSAQIIEGNLNKPEKVRTRAERIRTVADQGAGIVKAMLGFSRESNQEPAEVEINEVAKATLTLLGDRFLREVQIQFEPGQDLPPAVMSPALVQQILLNFIFNAAESMSEQKRIVVRTEIIDTLPEKMALVPASAPRYVRISVTDFGCGISAENLPRIFEPFFTTKALSTRRGTGLGLSMAYQLAMKLEAGLAVTTKPGQGSTFSLLIPLQPRAAGHPQEAS